MFEWVTDFWTGNRYHPWSVCWTTMQALLQASDWKQCVALGLPPQILADLPSHGVAACCQSLHLHLCPRDMWVSSVTGCAGGKTSPLHNSLSVTDNAEEVLPMAVFALRLLNSSEDKEKKWLLNWWLGLHNYFTSDQCCRLGTSVSVTGK